MPFCHAFYADEDKRGEIGLAATPFSHPRKVPGTMGADTVVGRNISTAKQVINASIL